MIRKNTGEPVYVTIAASLREQIVEGKMNPGDLLPSENVLVTRFSASRDTVRKSLKALETENYIYSQPGKGYFVAQPKHDQFVFDFSEEPRNVQANVKNITIKKPDLEVQAALNLPETRTVIEIAKTLLHKGVVVAYDLKYLPYDKGQPLIESEIQYAVFPEIASAKTAPFAFYTKMEISAESATEELGKLLDCPRGTALLVVKRYFVDHKDDVIGYGKQYMKPSHRNLVGYSGYGENT